MIAPPAGKPERAWRNGLFRRRTIFPEGGSGRSDFNHQFTESPFPDAAGMGVLREKDGELPRLHGKRGVRRIVVMLRVLFHVERFGRLFQGRAVLPRKPFLP